MSHKFIEANFITKTRPQFIFLATKSLLCTVIVWYSLEKRTVKRVIFNAEKSLDKYKNWHGMSIFLDSLLLNNFHTNIMLPTTTLYNISFFSRTQHWPYLNNSISVIYLFYWWDEGGLLILVEIKVSPERIAVKCS